MPVAVRAYRRSDFSWTCLTLSFRTEINATHQRSVQESFGSKIVRVSEESRKLPVALRVKESRRHRGKPRSIFIVRHRDGQVSPFAFSLARRMFYFPAPGWEVRTVATVFRGSIGHVHRDASLIARSGSPSQIARRMFYFPAPGWEVRTAWLPFATFDERGPLNTLFYTCYDHISSGPL